MAAVASVIAWLLRPDAAAGTPLGTMLAWAWAGPFIAVVSLFATMPKKPKPRAIAMLASLAIALLGTAYAGMMSIANQRVLHPDQMTWLDHQSLPEQADQVAKEAIDSRPVLDTARVETD